MRLLFVFVFLSSVAFGQINEPFYNLFQIDNYIKQIEGKNNKEAKKILKKHLKVLYADFSKDVRRNLNPFIGLASLPSLDIFYYHFKDEVKTYPLANELLKKNRLKKTLAISSMFIVPISGFAILTIIDPLAFLYVLIIPEGAAIYFGGSLLAMIPGIVILKKAQKDLIDEIRTYHKEYNETIN